MMQKTLLLLSAFLLLAAGPAMAQDKDEKQPEADKALVARDLEQISSLGIVRHQWGAINSNGTIARHRHALRAAKLGLGFYEVIFSRDVSKGLYVATIGSAGISGATTGQVSVSPRGGNRQGVFVRTTNSAGQQADLGFHLLVLTD